MERPNEKRIALTDWAKRNVEAVVLNEPWRSGAVAI